ncbi:hypothetical protein ACLOJK_015765 [Asimina triloba]
MTIDYDMMRCLAEFGLVLFMIYTSGQLALQCLFAREATFPAVCASVWVKSIPSTSILHPPSSILPS